MTLRAHALLVGHTLGAPLGEVVEGGGFLANGRTVQSAPAEERPRETERVRELVLVDRLLLQKVSGCLECHEHRLVTLGAWG